MPVQRSDLERALHSNELSLVFQPKISMATHQVIGAEALSRWRHPEKGNISPAEFIPLAEKTGLIGYLASWAIAEGLRQWSSWTQLGLETSLAVNLSAENVTANGFPDELYKLCQKRRMPPEMLVIEVTETSFGS